MITTTLLRNILWLLATLEVAISLYVLVLNFRNKINLHISWLMLIFAVNTLGLGLLVTADRLEAAILPMILLASSSLPVIVSILLIVLVLLFPDPPKWLRILRGVVYFLVATPIVLTLIDVIAGTTLWYGLSSEPYTGGYVGGAYYGESLIGNLLRAPLIYATGLATVLPSLIALFQRKNTTTRRRLAGILLGIQLITIVLQLGFRNVLQGSESSAAVNTVFAIGYGYIAFDFLFRYRTMQRGALQTRLTLLSLVVTIPVLVLVSLIAGQTGRELLITSAQEQLQNTNATLRSNVDVWINQNVLALQQLELQPEIRSMDPDLQKPTLERMTQTYPYMYLVSTTNLSGINVARSDGEDRKVYSDREWFLSAKDGQPVNYQTVIGRTSGEPALVVSVPIRGQEMRTAGVLMFAATLDDLRASVESARMQESGLDYYIIDEQNQLILASQSDTGILDNEAYLVPVEEMRTSGSGQVRYDDVQGTSWLAYVDSLSNGWTVVVEREEQVLLSPADTLQNTNMSSVGVSIILITILIYATVRQALRPIRTLTETADAIVEGDFSQRAPVESDDELGTLATSFNTMTDRLNELIAGLEGRVQRRTAALEQRSQLLQASADVGRAVSSILDTQELFSRVVDLIRESFDLYYVGLFQVDAANEWAVLRAGTGEAGRAMLSREHRILIGTGMVGWSIANSTSRVTSRAEEDAVRLASSELPDTRSEAALPLTSRGQVLGALTVQSAEPDFFDADTLTVLQSMADQIAVAIDNAGLYTSMQATLDAERHAVDQMISTSIEGAGSSANDWVFNRDTQQFNKPEGVWHPGMVQAQQRDNTVLIADEDNVQKVAVPIRVRGDVFGVLDLSRSGMSSWTQQEIALLETISEQLGAALESALLYETSQRRASREQMIRQITENISAATTVEDAMQRAMQALADVANAQQVAVRIGSQDMLSVQQGEAHEQ